MYAIGYGVGRVLYATLSARHDRDQRYHAPLALPAAACAWASLTHALSSHDSPMAACRAGKHACTCSIVSAATS